MATGRTGEQAARKVTGRTKKKAAKMLTDRTVHITESEDAVQTNRTEWWQAELYM
jgi:hypothetical protein